MIGNNRAEARRAWQPALSLGPLVQSQARPVEVVDTVGAGDSFTAALVLGLLHNMELEEINFIVNEVARYVCSRRSHSVNARKLCRQISNAPILLIASQLTATLTAKDHLRITATALRHWAIAQVQDSLAVGILWLVGLWIIHVPWAPLWAALAAVLQIIPHFGPILGLLGPVLAAGVSWRDWRHPLYVLILYAVIVVADGLLLQPYIMRRVVRVPMWASILAPVILGFVIPFWGVLLAPPLLAVVYAYRARRAAKEERKGR